ncbi:hypothetical protein [Microbacterium soli]|uniref:Uncharacterized protein n=1 Tax=Microbacterium soli TaxID=446075 RepID=A0ABP7NEG9_9MICO
MSTGRAEESTDDAVRTQEQLEPEYGILGFTLRELIILVAWAVSFVVSFFPVAALGSTVWVSGIDWILTIGVPTAAVFLLVLRRFSPEGIRRVGSLGIDQFASVAVSVSATVWVQLIWRQTAAIVQTGVFTIGWVPIVAAVAALALVASTVFAPLIPRLRDDFEGRAETLAHRNANPVRPVIPRTRRPASRAAALPDAVPSDVTDAGGTTVLPDAPSPAAHDDVDDDTRPRAQFPFLGGGVLLAEGPSAAAADPLPAVGDGSAPAGAPAGGRAEMDGDVADADGRENGTAYTDPIEALDEIFAANGLGVTSEPDEERAPRGLLRRNRSAQPRTADQEANPFWILAGTERDVLDEQGQPLFRIGPEAWALVIEDRGGAYVVRHDDGRIGFLHDITGITKG